jgi:16S rRNA (guanine527-N7)-methyltransferase
VTSREFRDRLARRARRANVTASAALVQALETYFTLLARWNVKINLTALPLDPPTDEAFDRLLVEPLAAARHVGNEPLVWFDLGSGGGSPAVPLKLSRPVLQLTMVESKARKAAFLRECVRTLALDRTAVENQRFEDLIAGDGRRASAQLVTVRAVRTDAVLFKTAAELLADGGRLMLFSQRADPRPPIRRTTSRRQHQESPGLSYEETFPLVDTGRSALDVYRRVFHVEQSG